MAADELEAQVREWIHETRVLLKAAELVVEWLTDAEAGARDEYEELRASLDLPYQNLDLIERSLDQPDAPDKVSRWTAKRFHPTEEVARAISPLAERVIAFQPDFVVDLAADEDGADLLSLWGQFIGNFGTYICNPMWSSHPNCAPPDWQSSRTEDPKS